MKIIRQVRQKWEVLRFDKSRMQSRLFLYPAYWKYLLHGKAKGEVDSSQYFAAIPNRGAGIGHQMSNWHAGYWYSKVFGLQHAHIPFAQKSWERFLGYGDGVTTVSDLKAKGYKIVHIPYFNEYSPKEMGRVRAMMSQYYGEKVIFCAEQDQSYHDQIGVIPYIREKFYSSPVRESDLTPFNINHFNIAVHVRRGDITIGQINGDPNLLMRWLDNEYFEKVLDQVLGRISTEKEIHIYLFSQGKKEDFKSFERFPNVHYYLDLNPESSFLSFVYADLLITSKSSFSYKPALLNVKGKKVCPRNFWHAYPNENDWILADDSGIIPRYQLDKLDL